MKRSRAFVLAVIVAFVVAAIALLSMYWLGTKRAEVYQSEVPTTIEGLAVHYFGNEIQADVNGDGSVDRVFLVTTSGSGSGTFFYVMASLNTSRGYVGTNTVFLGDRIAPQTTEVHDGVIVVNYATRKADQPMTAQPSVGVSKYFKVVDGRLMEETHVNTNQ